MCLEMISRISRSEAGWPIIPHIFLFDLPEDEWHLLSFSLEELLPIAMMH